jgi:hypothetical protein
MHAFASGLSGAESGLTILLFLLPTIRKLRLVGSNNASDGTRKIETPLESRAQTAIA